MSGYIFTEIDQLVGDNLKILREHSGVSRRLVADHLEVSCEQVQKYESGRNRISARRLYLLAELFEVPMADFFKDLA